MLIANANWLSFYRVCDKCQFNLSISFVQFPSCPGISLCVRNLFPNEEKNAEYFTHRAWWTWRVSIITITLVLNVRLFLERKKKTPQKCLTIYLRVAKKYDMINIETYKYSWLPFRSALLRVFSCFASYFLFAFSLLFRLNSKCDVDGFFLLSNKWEFFIHQNGWLSLKNCMPID